MVEPYLLSANGNSTTAQPSQLWPNEYPYSATTPNHNIKHQLFDSDDGDDDVQFVSEVIPAPGRPITTVDLSKSIFDVQKDDFDVYLNGITQPNNAAQAKYQTKPHTITAGQTSPRPVFDFAKENSRFDAHRIALPHLIPQTLPQINVANFAKEKVMGSNDYGANTSNDLLDLFGYDAVDWVEDPDVINQVFGSGHTEQLPKTIVPTATSTATSDDVVEWENIFGVMQQNQPGPSGITAHQPRQVFTNVGGTFEYGRRIIAPATSNSTQVTLNGTPIGKNDQQNGSGPNAARFNWPLLSQTNEVNNIYQQNKPGPSGITPRQPVDLGGYRRLLTPNVQQNQPGPSGITPRQPVDLGGYRQLLTINDQHNQPGPSSADPDWIVPLFAKPNLIEPLLPQTNKVNVNAASIYQQNPLGPNGTTQRQVNGSLTNGTSILKSIKRKHTATIPIKIVRSTKQYETLVEMGFPKKDIEIALRKCNLDLNETIEYLSEPKHAAKKQRIDLNDLYRFDQDYLNAIHQSLQEPNNDQSHEQPHKVDTKPVKKPANLYEELLQLEATGGIVKSIESFDCEICMDTIDMKDGIILRNCLHRYCKDCLNGTIVHSDEVSIKCPYVSCEEMVQDREIRAVLSQDEYEKFLMKGVRVAQVTISGTILCNFPDCNGWCICEDVVNEFKCPQCKNVNCIPCKAIHPERNCREYQDDLAAGDANGIISGQRRSEQAIKDLINRNEAMKCFSCGILIMKRDGCDYIQCAMCKAGICWATRGPRYGPGGVGDLSGGCQCSLKKKCHKDCRGCH
ncbi:uncharacterized protein LOC119073147 [Bradysia coprophila]|uniref:uncharacterized protein LOC119073147 n=1 Tax=Bradysia coprophila TaxID=38358 RepID=UPI00187D7329|nr:uncharacterized protein LOC119073147 [Bradysia coprophila]